MDPLNAVCINCNDIVGYQVAAVPMTVEDVEENPRTFLGREAYCCRCGAPVWADDVEDYNICAYNDIIRKEHDVLSIDEVLSIPAKYGIDVQSLASLLGVEYRLLLEVCEGLYPCEEIADQLKRITSDPLYFSSVLEAGRGKLSETAYVRSCKNADAVICDANMPGNGCLASGKTRVLATYLQQEYTALDTSALQQALYYIQGFSYALTGAFCIADDCAAGDNGIVFPAASKRIKEYEQITTAVPKSGTAPNIDMQMFSSAEMQIISAVAEWCSCCSSTVLVTMTRRETPWLIARAAATSQSGNREPVTKASLQSYFSGICSEYNIRTPADIPIYLQTATLCCRKKVQART